MWSLLHVWSEIALRSKTWVPSIEIANWRDYLHINLFSMNKVNSPLELKWIFLFHYISILYIYHNISYYDLVESYLRVNWNICFPGIIALYSSVDIIELFSSMRWYMSTFWKFKLLDWWPDYWTLVARIHTCTVYPKKYAHVFALLCFVVVIHWLIFPYPSGLLHWHCGNLTIAPVPAKQPWWIWINTSCEFIMNDCITTTKQSTTKPCAYFLGYTVAHTHTEIMEVNLPAY